MRYQSIKLNLLCALSVAPALTFGQTPSTATTTATDQINQSEVYTLPETIITANAVSLAADRVGSSVSTITSDELENRQIRRVSDALALLPGVNIARNGNRGIASTFVRGHARSDVLVLIDGVRLNDPSSINNAVDISYLQLNNVERIEFIKGAQSAKWGSNAVGGVINIITKDADEEGVHGNIGAEFGSDQYYQTSGTLNINDGQGHQFQVNLQRQDTDGISAAAEGDERDGYDSSIGQIKFKGQLTDALDVQINASKQQSTTEFDDYPPADNDDNFTDADIETVQAEINYDQGNFANRLYTNYANTIRRTLTTGPFGSDSTFEGRNRTLGYEGTLFFGAADQQSLSLNALHQEQSIRTNSQFAPTDKDAATREFALEYNGEFNAALDVSLAARYQDNDIFGSDTTYQASASYRLNDQHRLHSSFGTSVRNPSLTELYAPFGGNDTLEPQTSQSFDIGYEFSTLNDRLLLDATLFYSQVESPVGYENNQYINLDSDVDRRGLELSARGQITDRLEANAAYTYLKAEQDNGLQEIRRPKHSADVGLSYELSPAWQVGADIQYRGTIEDKNFQTFPAERIELDDYTLLGLRTDYQINDHLSAFGRIENLTDENYQEVFGYGTKGRSYYAGFEATF